MIDVSDLAIGKVTDLVLKSIRSRRTINLVFPRGCSILSSNCTNTARCLEATEDH